MSGNISPRSLSKTKYWLQRVLKDISIVGMLSPYFPTFRVTATWNGKDVSYKHKGFIHDDIDLVNRWYNETKSIADEVKEYGTLKVKLEYHFGDLDEWKEYLSEDLPTEYETPKETEFDSPLDFPAGNTSLGIEILRSPCLGQIFEEIKLRTNYIPDL